jgi:vacuolar protein sorting-associated protein 13A/C
VTGRVDLTVQLKMATSITTSIRYFNFANSYFEPLLDPWKFDLRVSVLFYHARNAG